MKRASGLLFGAIVLAAGCELVAISGEISGDTLAHGGSSTTSSAGGTGGGSSTTTTSSAPTACGALVTWVRVIDAPGAADLRVAYDDAKHEVVVGATVTGDVKVGTIARPEADGGSGRDILLVRYDGATGDVRRADRLGDAADQVLGGLVAAGGSTVVALHFDLSLGFGATCPVAALDGGPSTVAMARLDGNGVCNKAKRISDNPSVMRGLAADADHYYVTFLPTAGAQVSFNRLDIANDWTTSHYSDVVGADLLQPVIAGAAGHTFVAGTFGEKIEFGATVLATAAKGGRDAFLLRSDPPWSNLPVVHQFGAHSSDPLVYGLATDDSAPYLTGALRDTLDFGDGGALTAQAPPDVFVAKPGFPTSGAGDWNKRFGGAGAEWGTGIAVRSPLVAVVGSHAGGLTIGGTPGGELPARDGRDFFVAGLRAKDGEPRWSCSFGGDDNDDAAAVTIGIDGAVYVVGSFRGQADLGVQVDGGEGAIFVMRVAPP